MPLAESITPLQRPRTHEHEISPIERALNLIRYDTNKIDLNNQDQCMEIISGLISDLAKGNCDPNQLEFPCAEPHAHILADPSTVEPIRLYALYFGIRHLREAGLEVEQIRCIMFGPIFSPVSNVTSVAQSVLRDIQFESSEQFADQVYEVYRLGTDRI